MQGTSIPNFTFPRLSTPPNSVAWELMRSEAPLLLVLESTCMNEAGDIGGDTERGREGCDREPVGLRLEVRRNLG